MACALGPIHYWLFGQVRLAEARGRRLAAALAAAGCEDALAVWAAASGGRPAGWSEQPLDALITGTVHEGLEAMVAGIAAGEAALYALARERGQAAQAAFAEALRADGREAGAALRAGFPVGDARAIHASLREHWLEGMPCHVEIEVAEDAPAAVAWQRRGRPLAKYWTLSPVAASALAALHVEWMAAFVAGCGGQLESAPWPAGGEGAQAFRIVARH
ncbi:hypothetical protein FJ251_13120 [bacterium]|nr:hypothetical protein [bacterium]